MKKSRIDREKTGFTTIRVTKETRDLLELLLSRRLRAESERQHVRGGLRYGDRKVAVFDDVVYDLVLVGVEAMMRHATVGVVAAEPYKGVG